MKFDTTSYVFFPAPNKQYSEKSHPEDKNFDYSKAIDSELSQFFLFIEKLEDPSALQSQKTKIAYMLNRIDALLLLKIQNDFLNDPYSLASTESMSFITPKSIFLKKCKETLNIERDSKDFAHQVVDDVYSKILVILPSMLEHKTVNEIQREAMPRSPSLIRLFTASRNITKKIIEKIEGYKSNLLTGLLGAFSSDLPKIREISTHIKKTYLLEEHREHHFQRIFDSIIYRKQMDKYLYQKMQQEQTKKTQEFEEYCCDALKILEGEAFTFNQDSEKQLTTELKPIEHKILKKLISEDIARQTPTDLDTLLSSFDETDRISSTKKSATST